jgi:hypothetical protein
MSGYLDQQICQLSHTGAGAIPLYTIYYITMFAQVPVLLTDISHLDRVQSA